MSVYGTTKEIAGRALAHVPKKWLRMSAAERIAHFESAEWQAFESELDEYLLAEQQQIDFATCFEAEHGQNGVNAIRGYGDDDKKYLESEAYPVVMSSVTSRLAMRSMAATIMQPVMPEEFLLASLVPDKQMSLADEGSKIAGLFDNWKAKRFKENEAPPFVSLADSYRRQPETEKDGLAIAFSREHMWRRGSYINQYPIAAKLREALLRFREEEVLIPAFLNLEGEYDRDDVKWDAFYSAAAIASLGTNVNTNGPWVNVQVNPYTGFDSFRASRKLGTEMTGMMTGERDSKSYNVVIAHEDLADSINVQLNSTEYEADAPAAVLGLNNLKFRGSTNSLVSGDAPTRIYSNQRLTDAIQEKWAFTQANAEGAWYHGNPAQQMSWGSRQGWAMQVEQLHRGDLMQLRQVAFGLMAYDAGTVIHEDPREGVWNVAA